jgi:hypothetical protein
MNIIEQICSFYLMEYSQGQILFGSSLLGWMFKTVVFRNIGLGYISKVVLSIVFFGFPRLCFLFLFFTCLLFNGYYLFALLYELILHGGFSIFLHPLFVNNIIDLILERVTPLLSLFSLNWVWSRLLILLHLLLIQLNQLFEIHLWVFLRVPFDLLSLVDIFQHHP